MPKAKIVKKGTGKPTGIKAKIVKKKKLKTPPTPKYKRKKLKLV